MEVVVAMSGQEAINLMRTDRDGFDVIVLDYLMPDLNGLDVLRWMHEAGVETPAFILTAAGSESVAVEAMKLGAYDYCRKEGVQVITLEVRRSNYRAISLYRNFHFQPQGIRRRYYTDSGEDAVVMGLSLEGPNSPKPV
jgi:DNA-binding NtrC family response regulator